MCQEADSHMYLAAPWAHRTVASRQEPTLLIGSTREYLTMQLAFGGAGQSWLGSGSYVVYLHQCSYLCLCIFLSGMPARPWGSHSLWILEAEDEDEDDGGRRLKDRGTKSCYRGLDRIQRYGFRQRSRRIEESRSSSDLCPEMPSATLRSVALRCVGLATSLLRVESRPLSISK